MPNQDGGGHEKPIYAALVYLYRVGFVVSDRLTDVFQSLCVQQSTMQPPSYTMVTRSVPPHMVVSSFLAVSLLVFLQLAVNQRNEPISAVLPCGK